jgi:hypothetical protein
MKNTVRVMWINNARKKAKKFSRSPRKKRNEKQVLAKTRDNSTNFTTFVPTFLSAFIYLLYFYLDL